jgi:hypothetical protein
MADVTVPISGWSVLGWGDAAWGQGGIIFPLSASVGDVTVTIPIDVSVTGVEGASGVGSVSVLSNNVLDVTGFGLASAVNDVLVVVDSSTTVTGVEGTSGVGTVTVTGDSSTTITGFGLVSSVGEIAEEGSSSVEVTGISASTSAGDVTVDLQLYAFVTGVEAAALIPATTVRVDFTALVYPTGIGMTISTTPSLVWSTINTDQDPNWTPVVT